MEKELDSKQTNTDDLAPVLNPQDVEWNQYKVYPEDDGYDRFRNPYSPV